MPGIYKITTFGCQMNKSDSERLKTLLNGIGMSETQEDEKANLIVLNTCSVRQAAEDRVYGIYHQLSELKARRPELILAVTGCMAGRDKDGKIYGRLKDVDLFFPTEEMVFLPKRLAEINSSLIESEHGESEYEHYLNIQPSYKNKFQAFLAISNGCNKFCTYCVVPFSRGRQKDRPIKDVLEEARGLAGNGCLEITILGQTVNLYNPPDKEYFNVNNPFDRSANCFAALMWELNQIDGIERIHFTAPHPQHMDDKTIAALTLPKHLNYLHLPVQSGSNTVLKRMNRPYTREQYIDTIKKIREACPAIAIGTDIIVGFCGETEDDFLQTVDLYKQCDFDIAYMAMYSVRSGTAAARMYKDDVLRQDKKRRWRELHTLMEETVLRKNQAYGGQQVSVLVDGYEKGVCSGNSKEMKRVQFRGGEEFLGRIVDVRIDRALEWMLYGTVVSSR